MWAKLATKGQDADAISAEQFTLRYYTEIHNMFMSSKPIGRAYYLGYILSEARSTLSERAFSRFVLGHSKYPDFNWIFPQIKIEMDDEVLLTKYKLKKFFEENKNKVDYENVHNWAVVEEGIKKLSKINNQELKLLIHLAMCCVPKIHMHLAANFNARAYNDAYDWHFNLKQRYIFQDAINILQAFCSYSLLRRDTGHVKVQAAISIQQFNSNIRTKTGSLTTGSTGGMIEVDIERIDEVKYEQIMTDVITGSLQDPSVKDALYSQENDDEEEEATQVTRPVFKCKLTAEHQKLLKVEHVWVDCGQLATDFGSEYLIKQYIQEQKVKAGGKINREHMKDLMRELLSVVGAGSNEGKQNDDQETAQKEEEEETEQKKEESNTSAKKDEEDVELTDLNSALIKALETDETNEKKEEEVVQQDTNNIEMKDETSKKDNKKKKKLKGTRKNKFKEEEEEDTKIKSIKKSVSFAKEEEELTDRPDRQRHAKLSKYLEQDALYANAFNNHKNDPQTWNSELDNMIKIATEVEMIPINDEFDKEILDDEDARQLYKSDDDIDTKQKKLEKFLIKKGSVYKPETRLHRNTHYIRPHSMLRTDNEINCLKVFTRNSLRHIIDPTNLISYTQLNANTGQSKEMREQYLAYTKDLMEWTNIKSLKHLTKDQADKHLQKSIDFYQRMNKHQNALQDEDDYEERLGRPFYDKKNLVKNAHVCDLMQPKGFVHKAHEEENEEQKENRCCILGINALLGGCFFSDIESYFWYYSMHNRAVIKQVREAFRLKNEIPVPVGLPFAIVDQHQKLVMVTLIPVAEFTYNEMEVFMKTPILFEIFLTIRCGTSRVAIHAVAPRCLNDGEIANHMFVFQYPNETQGKSCWFGINPPHLQSDLSVPGMQRLRIEKYYSYKVYALLGTGPANPKQEVKQKIDGFIKTKNGGNYCDNWQLIKGCGQWMEALMRCHYATHIGTGLELDHKLNSQKATLRSIYIWLGIDPEEVKMDSGVQENELIQGVQDEYKHLQTHLKEEKGFNTLSGYEQYEKLKLLQLQRHQVRLRWSISNTRWFHDFTKPDVKPVNFSQKNKVTNIKDPSKKLKKEKEPKKEESKPEESKPEVTFKINTEEKKE